MTLFITEIFRAVVLMVTSDDGLCDALLTFFLAPVDVVCHAYSCCLLYMLVLFATTIHIVISVVCHACSHDLLYLLIFFCDTYSHRLL